MSDVLRDLQTWYAAQCNDEWEHRYGIKIETCDNPGWWVKVDLIGTTLDDRPFEPVSENIDAAGFQKGDRWLHCSVANRIWNGAGDETKLETILRTFLDWARRETGPP